MIDQNRRRHLTACCSGGFKTAAAVLLISLTGSALAQNFPLRPIRMVVPFPAGGATDIIARILTQRVAQSLGQPIVIDNKPGAGGTIGSDVVAKAPADGYTLLMATSSTHSIAPVLSSKIPYDAVKDFAAVALVGEAPSVLVVGSQSAINDIPSLVKMLKSNPGKYNFGSSGIGTYPHLAAEMFKWRAGNLYVVHIPYRGTGLVIPDLVSGQITFLMDSIVSAQTHIRDGKVRALAVSGSRRSDSLPSVPTFTELGIGGMEISNWFGVFAPAGIPEAIVTRLNQEFNQATQNAEIGERLSKLGAHPRAATPASFAKLYRDESLGWQAVIKRAGIQAE
jgi:tripartite-type tricarboxylate transporter receptor subunit TctC